MKWLRRLFVLGQLKVAQARAQELRDLTTRLPGLIHGAEESVRVLRCRLYDVEHPHIPKLRPHPSPVTELDRAREVTLRPEFAKPYTPKPVVWHEPRASRNRPRLVALTGGR